MSQFLSELQTPSVCLNFSRRCLGATKFLNPFDNRRDRRLPLSVFVRFLQGISYVFETVSREWSKSTKIAKNGACSSLAERRSVYEVGDGSRGPGRRLSPSPHLCEGFVFAFWCDAVTLHPSQLRRSRCHPCQLVDSCGLVRQIVDRQDQQRVHLLATGNIRQRRLNHV